MTGKRNIGSVAAIGGLSAAIALLTGLPAVSADELADLRANQELLQKRIDQLSQAPPPGAPGPYVPGFGPETRPADGTGHRRQLPAIVSDPRHRHLIAHRRHRLDRRHLVVAGARQRHRRSTTRAAIPTAVTNGMGGTGILPNIPLNNSIGHSRSGAFDISSRPSRLLFDARTPTAWGEVKAYIEMDFAATNENVVKAATTPSPTAGPRACARRYGTMGGLLVGQESGIFHDPDADAEIARFRRLGVERRAGARAAGQIHLSGSLRHGVDRRDSRTPHPG